MCCCESRPLLSQGARPPPPLLLPLLLGPPLLLPPLLPLPLLLLPLMLELSALAAARPAETVLSVSVLLPLPASMLPLWPLQARLPIALPVRCVCRSGSGLDMLGPSSLVLPLPSSLHAGSYEEDDPYER